jgi:hypothetical protein
MTEKKTYQVIRNAIDNSLLRREIQEAVEQGWLSEEEANAIRRLNVPSGERRKRLKRHRERMEAQSSQSAARAAKVRDLMNRPKSWKGLESYEPQPPER